MILAIDTSSAISVALVAGDTRVAGESVYAPRAHAETLSPMIQSVLAAAGCAPRDISAIAVGTGPAPFTGLRVGLVTARVLGRVWAVPVRGWCSLDALGAKHGGEVTVAADARRGEVYWATYAAGVRLEGPGVSRAEEVPATGDVIGRGVALYREALGASSDDMLDPDPAWLARVIAREMDRGAREFPTEPLYLRRPDVHGDARP